ncbi:hypothetical protein GUITHDRAFT_122280 [Guillardia theta CCMP2712]|uniref:Uncharacterized protein n=1 Tax=Guillardia theta (strain CCMP2712) TaxID=905079 RepID=L1I5K5_GUITC|nr:hypothetical protein GUITHDRAFT_122280 [Guillardia theta CCMP2712]EKX31521.1 hypothetical protein GUITHDRAFT_122280 [Guillardia theta CCMP2712]|eukprot:XP_005818501.1 hypothetical protein GUITHDRAFT_122280 [Guillardia theta CCMP2712]
MMGNMEGTDSELVSLKRQGRRVNRRQCPEKWVNETGKSVDDFMELTREEQLEIVQRFSIRGKRKRGKDLEQDNDGQSSTDRTEPAQRGGARERKRAGKLFLQAISLKARTNLLNVSGSGFGTSVFVLTCSHDHPDPKPGRPLKGKGVTAKRPRVVMYGNPGGPMGLADLSAVIQQVSAALPDRINDDPDRKFDIEMVYSPDDVKNQFAAREVDSQEREVAEIMRRAEEEVASIRRKAEEDAAKVRKTKSSDVLAQLHGGRGDRDRGLYAGQDVMLPAGSRAWPGGFD